MKAHLLRLKWLLRINYALQVLYVIYLAVMCLAVIAGATGVLYVMGVRSSAMLAFPAAIFGLICLAFYHWYPTHCMPPSLHFPHQGFMRLVNDRVTRYSSAFAITPPVIRAVRCPEAYADFTPAISGSPAHIDIDIDILQDCFKETTTCFQFPRGLDAIIAHETGHAIAAHSRLVVLGILFSMLPTYVRLVWACDIVRASISRFNEYVADEFSLYLTNDPSAVRNLLLNLVRVDREQNVTMLRRSRILSGHPPPVRRVLHIRMIIEKFEY